MDDWKSLGFHKQHAKSQKSQHFCTVQHHVFFVFNNFLIFTSNQCKVCIGPINVCLTNSLHFLLKLTSTHPSPTPVTTKESPQKRLRLPRPLRSSQGTEMLASNSVGQKGVTELARRSGRPRRARDRGGRRSRGQGGIVDKIFCLWFWFVGSS